MTLAAPLPAAADVLDIGCGPGAQTIDIAELLPDARITALDAHQPFLDQLKALADTRGVAERVTAMLGDMAALPFPPESFDLLWSEGAAYFLGVDEAMAQWRQLLRPGGVLALTEPVWLIADPPERARKMWAAHHGMRSRETLIAAAQAEDYHLEGAFVLPESAWWDDYYRPMKARLDQLEHRFAGDEAAQEVLAEAREEIACYGAHCDAYGYLFMVLRR